MLDVAILGLLQDQPLHGYELKKRLGETLGFLWGASYGSLYPALRRLERAGAIESVEPVAAAAPVPPTGSLTGDLAAARLRAAASRLAGSGRRTRKAFRITARGETRLRELLMADDPQIDDEKSFALKLAFCRHLPGDARLAFLERRRAALAARTDQRQPSASARASRGGRTLDRYTLALLEHRKKSTQRDLEWVEELLAAERGDEPPAPITPTETDGTTGAAEREGAAA